MLNMPVNPAVSFGDCVGVRRAPLLAALLLGASLAPAFAQSPAVPLASPSVGMVPSLDVPGEAETETAPAISGSTDAAPVGAAPPTLTAPETGTGAGAPQTSGSEQPAAAGLATDTDTDTGPTAGTDAVAAPPVETTDAPPSEAGMDDAPQIEPTSASGAEAASAAPELDTGLPHDLSPMGMYAAADVVVKGVMIGLALASLLTWTVFVVKVFEIFGAGRRVRRTIRTIRGAGSLQDARDQSARQRGPASFMIREAAQEYSRSYGAVAEAGGDGIKERVGSALSRIEAQAVRRMQRGTGLLASIGSVAPFVGLFGTVWGIMNSFIGIAETQTTNLAVVAPGIAEALLATAIGLVAAIPAVIFYNGFARAITGYRQKLIDALAGVERLVSRDLDFRVEPRAPVQQQR